MQHINQQQTNFKFAHKQHLSNISKQKGMSLAEFALYLILAGLLIAGVISLFLSNSDSANASNESKTVLSGIAKLKQAGQAQGNFTGFDINTIASAFNRTVSGSAIDSSFGTGSITAGTATTTTLPIVYSQVIPASACQAFISSVQGAASKVLVQASAGAAATSSNTVKDLSASTPLQFSSVITASACNANGSNGLIAATITIPLR